MRLDRLLSNLPRFSRQDARLLLVSGRLRVDGEVVRDGRFEVREFSRVELDDEVLQAGKPARYFMLHKPEGCVSATRDAEHRTVLDLLDEPDKHELHIGGRLDYNSTGLLLITNDGLWSRRMTLPGRKLPKVYYVETEQPIEAHYAETFAKGLYFRFEDLTTLPAQLEILDTRAARLTLHEGRYHQVKRMFGHFQNKVTRLHRESMAGISLDPALAPGQYRALSAAEVAASD
ncbi:pseudouridine synthase [Pseudomonas knackmussii]|uniref:pseudouridine synthase n=1 Tax=Pseudomonas knackmussii TaxID=65741 RepID=UPI0013638189|nr:pseudouridine synthase [Pseudomonas knackmussii]